jgi:hypothetical protein
MMGKVCLRQKSNNFSSQSARASTRWRCCVGGLQRLFGDSFQPEVRSEIGEGTTVTMPIPLRKPFGFDLEAPISQGPKDLPLARQTTLQFTIHKTQNKER